MKRLLTIFAIFGALGLAVLPAQAQDKPAADQCGRRRARNGTGAGTGSPAAAPAPAAPVMTAAPGGGEKTRTQQG